VFWRGVACGVYCGVVAYWAARWGISHPATANNSSALE
jgi:hypothetical protein